MSCSKTSIHLDTVKRRGVLMDWQRETSKQLVRIEQKLDNHLSRISRIEESMIWLKGHVNIVTLAFLTTLGGVVTYILQ
jgi:hypothetical protein